MSVDPETRAFYDRAATEYADKFGNKGKAGTDLLAFMEALPKGGRVLDLGCGPGRSAWLLQEAGFEVEATDASDGMLEIARTRYGIEGRLASFDDLDVVAAYDGIWANFSLLHAPLADLPRHFGAISTALKPGGVFHIGMKVGDGERRDHLGRKYAYVTRTYLTEQFAAVNLTPIKTREFHETGMAGTNDPCLAMLAGKSA